MASSEATLHMCMVHVCRMFFVIKEIAMCSKKDCEPERCARCGVLRVSLDGNVRHYVRDGECYAHTEHCETKVTSGYRDFPMDYFPSLGSAIVFV